MKGKIEVVFTITGFGADPKVTMRALLRKEGINAKKGSLAGALVLKPKYEIKKYETFQLIASQNGMLDDIDEAVLEGKGTIKLCIDGLDADFIKSTRRSDGSEYHAVVVNLGTKSSPHPRAFYLSDIQSELVKTSFKSKYDFTQVERYEEEAEEEILPEEE